MAVIRIREQAQEANDFKATLIIEGGEEYPYHHSRPLLTTGGTAAGMVLRAVSGISLRRAGKGAACGCQRHQLWGKTLPAGLCRP